jgi:hypothetical protein
MPEPAPHPTPIPAATTRKRKLSVQHAARLYIYEGIDSMTELSKRTGVPTSYLNQCKNADAWDAFAAELWASRSPAGVTIRTVEEQSLIDGEKRRQRVEIPQLTVESDRVLAAMLKASPGSKIHTALLISLARLRSLIEGSTHYDLAKLEASARMRIAIAAPQPITPMQHAGAPPAPEAGAALDLSDWQPTPDPESLQHAAGSESD